MRYREKSQPPAGLLSWGATVELIIVGIVAFFFGGLSGWLLRATRESPLPGRTSRRDQRRALRAVDAQVRRTTVDRPARSGGTAPAFRARTHAVPAPPLKAEGTRVNGDALGGDGTWNVTRPATVLVADDRLELVALHSAHLQRHGYRVLTATDGDAALALARAEHPSVAVLDHSMPGRSGIEVARALKADPATADITVLLMTAHSYGAIGATAREAGCVGFMSKPCDPSRVLREVASYVTPAN